MRTVWTINCCETVTCPMVNKHMSSQRGFFYLHFILSIWGGKTKILSWIAFPFIGLSGADLTESQVRGKGEKY